MCIEETLSEFSAANSPTWRNSVINAMVPADVFGHELQGLPSPAGVWTLSQGGFQQPLHRASSLEITL